MRLVGEVGPGYYVSSTFPQWVLRMELTQNLSILAQGLYPLRYPLPQGRITLTAIRPLGN